MTAYVVRRRGTRVFLSVMEFRAGRIELQWNAGWYSDNALVFCTEDYAKDAVTIVSIVSGTTAYVEDVEELLKQRQLCELDDCERVARAGPPITMAEPSTEFDQMHICDTCFEKLVWCDRCEEVFAESYEDLVRVVTDPGSQEQPPEVESWCEGCFEARV